MQLIKILTNLTFKKKKNCGKEVEEAKYKRRKKEEKDPNMSFQ